MDSIEDLYTKMYLLINEITDHKDNNIRDQEGFIKNLIDLFSKDQSASDAWVKSIKDLNELYQGENRVDEAIDLINNHKDHSNDKISAEFYDAQIINYFLSKNIDMAIKTAEKHLELREIINESKTLANAYHILGTLKHLSGSIEDAVDHYKNALEIIKRENPLKDSEEFSEYIKLVDQYVYNLANIYQHYLGDFKEAFNYYQQAYEIAKDNYDNQKIIFVLDHLGMAKCSEKDYSSAIEYHIKADKLFEDQNGVEYLFHNVQKSMSFIGLQKYEMALQSLVDIAHLIEENKEIYSNALIYLLLSDIIRKDNRKITEIIKNKFYFIDNFSELNLINMAMEVSDDGNHANSSVVAVGYKARYLHSLNSEDQEIVILLKKAKQTGLKYNRGSALKTLEDLCADCNVDFTKL